MTQDREMTLEEQATKILQEAAIREGTTLYRLGILDTRRGAMIRRREKGRDRNKRTFSFPPYYERKT